MTQTSNNNSQIPVQNNTPNTPSTGALNTTWVTVNTSTSANVSSMEISKSNDYDRIVKK